MFGTQLHYCTDVIKQMLVRALQSNISEVCLSQCLSVCLNVYPPSNISLLHFHFPVSPLQVTNEAFKAAVAFVVFLEDNTMRNKFIELVPLLLHVNPN